MSDISCVSLRGARERCFVLASLLSPRNVIANSLQIQDEWSWQKDVNTASEIGENPMLVFNVEQPVLVFNVEAHCSTL